MKHGNAATVSLPPAQPITKELLRKPVIAASGGDCWPLADVLRRADDIRSWLEKRTLHNIPSANSTSA